MPGAEELVYSVFLAFGLALTIGKLMEELFSRLGAPPVLGDLLAGLILGSTLLGIYPTNDVIKSLSWFGISLLLFYAGLETRYSEFMRSLPTYGVITVGEVIAAFGLGYLVGMAFGYGPSRAYFIGTILVATSVSLSVRTLIEIGKLTSIEGKTILGIAVLDDLAALIVIVAGASIAKTGALNPISFFREIAVALVAWYVTLVALHKASNYVVKFSRKLRVEGALFSLMLGIFAILAFVIKYVGISYLVVAYAAGLAFSEARGIRRVAESVRSLALPFSVLFFMTTAAVINIRTALNPRYTLFYLAMISMAFLGKLMGGGLTSFLVGYPARAAIRIGVGLFPRAEFCIVAAYSAYMHHILGPEAYLAALLITLTTNFLTPPLLKLAFLRGPETKEVRPRIKVLIERIRRRRRRVTKA